MMSFLCFSRKKMFAKCGRKKTEILGVMRDLPHDLITQNILTRLPIKPLVRFKEVSKQWYSTLSSPYFAQTHLKFLLPSGSESMLIRSYSKYLYLSYENGEANVVNLHVNFDVGNEFLVLVGSCNGLVCLGSTSGCLFVLWNPITREFRKYLDYEISKFRNAYMTTWGFGYVSATDDYKVIRICKIVSNPYIRVRVFSLRCNKWRSIDDGFSHNFPDLRTAVRLDRPGVLVNETLYWMGGVPIAGRVERRILSFNLALELLDTFPHLHVSTPSSWECNAVVDDGSDEFLCVVKGCLSKYGILAQSGKGIVTILKHPGETEQLSIDIDVVNSHKCNNLIGLTSDKFFIQYFGSHETHLGIADSSSWHTKLMTFGRWSNIEIAGYSATLISPPVATRVLENSDS